jgi:hypothetical protein
MPPAGSTRGKRQKLCDTPFDTPPTNVVELKPRTGETQKSRQLWTGPVIDRGYSIVPTILMWGQAKLKITSEEMNVLLQIISHRWSAHRRQI